MQPVRVAMAVFLVCGSACQAASEPPLVQFGSAPVVGKWQTPDSATANRTSPLATAGAPGLDSPPTAPNEPAATPPVVGVAGRPAPPLGAAGMAAPPMAAGAAAMPPASAAAKSGVVRSVSFDVLTATQGGRYQPRNIGAIWIADGAGKLIKSLKVWARIRQRYLVKYNAARSGMPIDVTATATLSSHQMHRVSWDLKDRAGAAAPPGKYRVVIEVTDNHEGGVLAQFDFDTSLGPATLMPASTPQYSMLKLQLSE
jgi:hypothetical protein